MTDDALRRLSPRFEAMYATTGRPSIPPEHLLRALLLQVLYSVRSERMLMEQLRVQPAVSVVCRPRHGRRRVGADDLHQESGSAARGRHRARLLRRRRRAGPRPPPAVGRALHRRRHAAGGVGRPEEFQAEGSAQRAARRSGQSDGQFPRRTALESDASVDDRSRQPAVQEGQGPRSQAGLSRRSADGEPSRPGRRRVRRAGDRHRRTRRGDRVSSRVCRADA